MPIRRPLPSVERAGKWPRAPGDEQQATTSLPSNNLTLLPSRRLPIASPKAARSLGVSEARGLVARLRDLESFL